MFDLSLMDFYCWDAAYLNSILPSTYGSDGGRFCFAWGEI